MVEPALEACAPIAQLAFYVARVEHREVAVVDGMRADRDSAILEGEQVPPRQIAWVAVGDPRRDHVVGRGHVQTDEHRRGLAEHVAVAIVERDHHRVRREASSVLERIEQLQLRHGVESVRVQPRHLRRERAWIDRQASRDRGERRPEDVDSVVHEDRYVQRSLRQR
jgi:hypothetical protein